MSDDKKQMYTAYNSILENNYKKAMKVINEKPKNIENTYKFSHYIIKEDGSIENTPLIEKVYDTIETIDEFFSLEINAFMKNEGNWQDTLEMPILYVNGPKNEMYLGGEAVNNIDSDKLNSILLIYTHNRE